MLRRALLLTLLIGCATARQEAQSGDDANTDASPADAAKTTGDAAGNDATTTACSFTGVLATYSFTGATGNQAQTAASSTATGMVAAPITRSATLTAVSGATSINSSNWPLTAQLDTTKYYVFAITPPTGCKLSLTSAAIDGRASGTGPAMAVVATSADNFAATVAISTTAPSTPTLAVTNATGAIEIRVYGYAATATGGTFRLQNTLTVSGSLN